MKNLFVFITAIALTFANSSFAQDDLVMFNGTLSSCNGQFFDDGGASGGPYTNTNYTFTICPDNPGDVIQVEFVAFQLQTSPNPNNSDWLFIYDGDNTSANSMGSYTGNNLQGLAVTGTTNNVTGCLTFVFQVNTGNTNSMPGWEGLVSCTTPCDPPTSMSFISNPVPAIDTIQSVGVCQGELVTFDGTESFAATGFNLAEYVWNFDDGTVDNTSGSTVSYSWDEPGEYIVNLSVVDNNGCNSLNLDPLQVLVSTTPIFNSVVTPEVCLGGEACADGSPIESTTWTALPPQVVAGETYLADGAGFSYSTTLTFDFFEPDATLDNCDDLFNVLVNMEHSYMGDLQVELECPDGTTVVLVEFPSGGGGTFLGEAIDDGSTDPGIGWDYYWDPDATNGTWGDNAMFNTSLPSGTYESVYNMCDFVGCPLNGDWTLSIIDNLAIDNGYIFYWGINFNPELFPGITTFTPQIGMQSDSTWWDATNISFVSDDGNSVCITPPSLGDYDLTFHSINDFGCQFDTTVTITAVPGPLVDAGLNQAICSDPVQLEPIVSVDGNPSDCVWTLDMQDTFGDGWNGSNVDVVVNGVVEYNFTIAMGSSAIETFVVSGGASVQIIYNDVAFANEISMTLLDDSGNEIFSIGPGGLNDGDVLYDGVCGGFGTYVYEWTPTNGLSDPSIPNPIADVSETTVYTVTVYPDGFFGCATTDSMTVQVDPLGDPGQSTVWTFCFNEGEFNLIDLLDGNPVLTGVWTNGVGDIVTSPVFNTYTDLGDVFTYTVTNGPCIASAQVDITVIPVGDPICCQFTYTESVADPSCFDYSDGAYSIAVSESTEGGPWNITVLDENGNTVSSFDTDGGPVSFEELPAAQYTVELVDAGLCYMSFNVELIEPGPILLETVPDTTICVNGTALLGAYSPQDPMGNWDYLWNSGLGSGTVVTDNPTENSSYEVFVVDNIGCISDVRTVNVSIYDSLDVVTIQDIDICQNSAVDLGVASFTGGFGDYTYQWSFSGVDIGTGETYTYLPQQNGSYCVTLTDGCESPPVQDCMEVIIEEAINVQIAADTTKGCAPAEINLFVSPQIAPELYSVAQWNLSDGWYEMNAPEFGHTFETPGFYDVNLTLTSPLGCEYSGTFNNYFTIYDVPTAGYYADPQPTQAPNTEINFSDWSSSGVVSWYWEFNTTNVLGTSIDKNPSFTFPLGVGGDYPVSLTVTDGHGCTDEVTRIIVIDDIFNIFVPNAFTPNQDGFNDVFYVEGTDIDPNRYEIKVFDRWGEKVWESRNPSDVWTGGVSNSDYYAGNNTYLWRMVVYSKSRPERHEILGYVTMIR